MWLNWELWPNVEWQNRESTVLQTVDLEPRLCHCVCGRRGLLQRDRCWAGAVFSGRLQVGQKRFCFCCHRMLMEEYEKFKNWILWYFTTMSAIFYGKKQFVFSCLALFLKHMQMFKESYVKFRKQSFIWKWLTWSNSEIKELIDFLIGNFEVQIWSLLLPVLFLLWF